MSSLWQFTTSLMLVLSRKVWNDKSEETRSRTERILVTKPASLRACERTNVRPSETARPAVQAAWVLYVERGLGCCGACHPFTPVCPALYQPPYPFHRLGVYAQLLYTVGTRMTRRWMARYHPRRNLTLSLPSSSSFHRNGGSIFFLWPFDGICTPGQPYGL